MVSLTNIGNGMYIAMVRKKRTLITCAKDTSIMILVSLVVEQPEFLVRLEATAEERNKGVS